MVSNFLNGGKFDKFLVIKRADIQKYLHPALIENLYRIIDYLSAVKKLRGKKIVHKYLVINVDEPYAPEIVEILKRNGHWG